MIFIKRQNRSLRHLSLACNKFGIQGCQTLLEGLQSNDYIQRLDLRLAECGSQTDLKIQVRKLFDQIFYPMEKKDCN